MWKHHESSHIEELHSFFLSFFFSSFFSSALPLYVCPKMSQTFYLMRHLTAVCLRVKMTQIFNKTSAGLSVFGSCVCLFIKLVNIWLCVLSKAPDAPGRAVGELTQRLLGLMPRQMLESLDSVCLLKQLQLQVWQHHYAKSCFLDLLIGWCEMGQGDLSIVLASKTEKEAFKRSTE